MQTGKTQTMALYLLWVSIFHKNETIVVGSYRVSAVKEIMDRIRYALESLPDFLKPPVEVYNKFELRFTNKSSIIGQVVSENFARGKSPTICYIDETTFIEEDVMQAAYDSFSPALDAAGKHSTSKLIFTSTPMGSIGFYYRIVSGAISKTNPFVYHKVDHTRIPGRDEEFRKQKIAELGLAKYMTEYEGAFVSSKKLLIDSVLLESIVPLDPVKVIDNTIDVFTDTFKGKRVAIACDIGLGVGHDYSIIQVYSLDEPFTQLLEYASNTRTQTEFFKDIMKVLRLIINDHAEEVYLSFESNSIGQGISRLIEATDSDYLSKAIIISDIDSNGQSTGRLGLTTTQKSKTKGLSDLKDLVESGRMKLQSHKLINELRVLERTRNGGFAAASGYFDDRVMATCVFCNMLGQIMLYDDQVYETYNKVDYIEESDDVFGIY